RHLICSELDEFDNPIRFKTDFKEGDPEVISWVKLISVGGPAICRWVWKDPSGNVRAEASVEITGERETEIVYSRLFLEPIVFEAPGFWSVLFYTDDKYQFTDRFTILSTKPSTATTTATAATTREAGPGFFIELVKIESDPERGVAIYPGDSVTFTLTFKNSGTGPANNFELRPLEVPEGVRLVEASEPIDLKAGETKKVRLRFLCESPGEYRFDIATIVEGEPLSETLPATITVSQPTTSQPKITLAGIKASPGEGEEINPGDEVTFTISLRNTGTSTIRGVEIKPAHLPEGIKLTEATPPSEIKPGELKDFKLRFKCEKVGSYRIGADVFVQGEAVESDITMNISVTEPAAGNWLLAAALLALVIIIIAAAVLVRRRRARAVTVPPVVVAPPTEVKETAEEARFCIHCGAPIEGPGKFCGKCGKPQV
ncbi:MAG: hypothetical protein QW390_00975, partial [Candidatus Bathyarchaeia archaeon]